MTDFCHSGKQKNPFYTRPDKSKYTMNLDPYKSKSIIEFDLEEDDRSKHNFGDLNFKCTYKTPRRIFAKDQNGKVWKFTGKWHDLNVGDPFAILAVERISDEVEESLTQF